MDEYGNIDYGSGGNSSSPNLLDWFKTGSTTATGILGALNKPKTTTPGTTNWTMIAGIGAAVLGVLVLLMVVAKK